MKCCYQTVRLMVFGVIPKHRDIKRCSDGELLYLFGTPKTRYLGQLYKKRWKIEVLFQ